jgi:hypothetical protein
VGCWSYNNTRVGAIKNNNNDPNIINTTNNNNNNNNNNNGESSNYFSITDGSKAGLPSPITCSTSSVTGNESYTS